MPDKIECFRGDFSFLSNFFPVEINVSGKVYPSVEHAYQAFKAITEEDHEKIRLAPTPAKAKRMGAKVSMRQEMFEDKTRIKLMLSLLRIKFKNPALREMLLATGDAEIIEGNTWYDRFWGVCDGVGENILGKLLQQVRDEIIRSQWNV